MANTKNRKIPLLTASAIRALSEQSKVHRLNKRAIRNTKSLGDAVGMKEMGIHLVRIKHGNLSTEFHTHHCDEEFVYILSGNGLAEIGKRQITVGPGDFIGFVAQSLPHAMSNPYKEDLVYLLGGTRKPYDVTEYPRAQKRAYKFSGRRHSVRFADTKEES